MSQATIHPRIAVRALENLSRRLEVEQNSAIADLERALDRLRELVGKPSYRFAEVLVGDYEVALSELKSVNPDHPPSAKAVLEIGKRLESACTLLTGEHEKAVAGPVRTSDGT